MTLFDLDARAETQRQLQALADALVQENRELTAAVSSLAVQHAAAEAATSDYVKLCVAHERLHDADSPAATLAAIDEIVSGLIGCEEYLVLVPAGSDAPRVLYAGPLAGAPLQASAPGDGAIAAAFLPGAEALLLAPALAHEPERLSAAVPLRHGGETVGVLALYRLLEHRMGRDALDEALLDLLGRRAGRALGAVPRGQAASA